MVIVSGMEEELVTENGNFVSWVTKIKQNTESYRVKLPPSALKLIRVSHDNNIIIDLV